MSSAGCVPSLRRSVYANHNVILTLTVRGIDAMASGCDTAHALHQYMHAMAAFCASRSDIQLYRSTSDLDDGVHRNAAASGMAPLLRHTSISYKATATNPWG